MLFVSQGELFIVRDGPERPFLEKLTFGLGLSKRVHFTGNVSAKKRDRLYAESGCGVYVPFHEPFGMMPWTV